MGHRIAYASTDGKYIDQHFGHADKFYIVDLYDNCTVFVETRTRYTSGLEPGHNIKSFDSVANLLSDCEGIFVSQIGNAAAHYLNTKGFRVFESPYTVIKVLEKLLTDHVF